MASLAVYQLSNAASDIIGFIIGGMLFCTGVFYLVLHFFGVNIDFYNQEKPGIDRL